MLTDILGPYRKRRNQSASGACLSCLSRGILPV
jgi:hypothetical protein